MTDTRKIVQTDGHKVLTKISGVIPFKPKRERFFLKNELLEWNSKLTVKNRRMSVFTYGIFRLFF